MKSQYLFYYIYVMVFTTILILFSPAKTINLSLMDHSTEGNVPRLTTDAEFLASKMRGYSDSELAHLLNIIPTPLGVNHEQYQHFNNPSTTSKAAIFVHNRSILNAISPSKFTASDTAHIQEPGFT